MPHRNGALVIEERTLQRPPTVLLRSKPQAEYQRLPLRPKEMGKGKEKQAVPNFIRHDTGPGQHWWQAGRGLLDRSGSDSGPQEDGPGRGGR